MMQQVTTNSGEISQQVTDLKESIRAAKALTTMPKEETIRMRLDHVGPSVTLFFNDNPLKIVQGDGQYLVDDEGVRYLDCINNVAHVGHANKRLSEAVSRQLSHLNTNSRFLHDSLSTYAKRLTSLFPKHLSVCYLVNSGSEANDLAIRLARAYTGRKDIVCVEGAYHGNLTSTMAISPYKKSYKSNSHNSAKWAHVAPMPCEYSGIHSRDNYLNLAPDSETIGHLYASEVNDLMDSVEKRGRQVAAFFVESMVSCGGQFPLPRGYLSKLQHFLRERGSLLVCDEVQTGFGRCGEHMWAFQLAGDQVEPDIVTVGKPMGNGFPVSAVITRPEIGRAFAEVGEYFNTFGGNPASCAAALAVLDELEERKLQESAKNIGSFMLAELRQLARQSRVIGDVRGVGFFIGIELVEDLRSKMPAPQHARFLVRCFRDERILMSTEGVNGNVLKFKPPMVFNMDNAKHFLVVLESGLAELERQLDIEHAELPVQLGASSSGSSSSTRSSSSWLESSTEI